MGYKVAMISSTARDLPMHRKQVAEACHRMGVFAEKMMEHLTAENANAVEVSLRLVDEADVYIGIFAHRYGFIPDYNNSNEISITEMEYNRASARGIPRLIFFMDESHESEKSDVDTGPKAKKLKHLKERIRKELVVAFFSNPDDLRAHVIQALAQLKDKWKGEVIEGSYQTQYIHPMTIPPEPYIAHPYVLSQMTGLIGRKHEIEQLNNWIRGKGHLADVQIFNIIAIGGMGKSALAWEWFCNIVPLVWPEITGRFWWSFYENDAYFENFIIRALAYVSHSTPDKVQKTAAPERETALLQILDREQHLFVLDGLERTLIAYARMDAVHLTDDDYEGLSNNYSDEPRSQNFEEKDTFADTPRLRKTTDLRVGQFLKKLVKVRASRILITSRLYPFDLQMLTGDPLPGCTAMSLNGLSDDDALALWRHFGCTGAREELLHLFQSFEKHPLLLQSLAGEIARWRPAPGDFTQWRYSNPDFDPFSLPLKQVKSHILYHATNGLSEAEDTTLCTIAAFRMPVQYDTLCDLLIEKQRTFWQRLFSKRLIGSCKNEVELDEVMQNLEDRGLVGWDRRANRYDLHPIVRGTVWNYLSDKDERAILFALKNYFEGKPKKLNWWDVEDLEDLEPSIELFYTLVRLGRQVPAFMVFMQYLDDAILYKIGNYRIAVEMLEEIWRNPMDHILETKTFRARLIKVDRIMFNAMALSYKYSGEPQKAVDIYEYHLPIEKANSKAISVYESLFGAQANFADTLIFIGKLRYASETLNEILSHPQFKKDSFEYLIVQCFSGVTSSLQGNYAISEDLFLQILTLCEKENEQTIQGIISACFSGHALRKKAISDAIFYANEAWNLAQIGANARHLSAAACLQGQAALASQDYGIAEERLHYAHAQALAINFAEGIIPALIALAELARQKGDFQVARDLLNDVWDYVERGPYPLFHADACNVLCQIERDARNYKAAIAAAEQAYQLAWCDGPPWAYDYGLEQARKHLKELGSPEPEMGGECSNKCVKVKRLKKRNFDL